MSKENDKIIAFKGFDKDFSCLGFRYEIGKTYIHEGTVVKCTDQGFHACQYPLDVFSYYRPDSSRFAIVESFGDVDCGDGSDTKFASASITIKAELKLPELVQHAINWIAGKIDKSIKQTTISPIASNTGNYSAASNTGDRSAASNTGNRSAASVEGAHSIAFVAGRESKAKASKTGAIVLVFRGYGGEIEHIRASKVGENGIKPDTYYTLNEDGYFCEAYE